MSGAHDGISVLIKERETKAPSLSLCHVKTKRRHPSVSQEEGSHQELHLSTP